MFFIAIITLPKINDKNSFKLDFHLLALFVLSKVLLCCALIVQLSRFFLLFLAMTAVWFGRFRWHDFYLRLETCFKLVRQSKPRTIRSWRIVMFSWCFFFFFFKIVIARSAPVKNRWFLLKWLLLWTKCTFDYQNYSTIIFMSATFLKDRMWLSWCRNKNVRV